MDNAASGGNGESSTGESNRVAFTFSGQGGEYFRIWIVNLLLSIITLGIYSAWAKVRREQYFHRHTQLANSPFEYHGQPWSILKGRLLVVGFLIIYNVLAALSPILLGVFMVAYLFAVPWVVRQALRFRTFNTSWRGIRMGFAGSYGGFAKIFYLNGLLVIVTLGIAAPWWLRNFQRYVVSNLRFGGQQFESDAPVWAYFKPYLVAMGLTLLGSAIIGIVFAVVGGSLGMFHGTAGPAAKQTAMIAGIAIGIVFYGFVFLLGSYIHVRISNALWNNTRLGGLKFASNMGARSFFWLMLTNILGIIFSIGLFAPFAKVRMARYRAVTMAIDQGESLDNFAAERLDHVLAVGDAAAEFLDIDLGF